MSFEKEGWVFISTNGDQITFRTVVGQGQFELFYDQPEDLEHGILFEKEDIPELIKLLLEIKGE